MPRLRLTVALALLGFGLAATPAAAADPDLRLSVSSPVTFWGGSVKVKVSAAQPGRVWLAQSRRYVIETPGTGSCGWSDKYVVDLYGVHGHYLPERSGAVLDGHRVEPGAPYTVTLQGAGLQFGAGTFPWESGDTWPGCRTRWTPYDRLTAYFASDENGQPGGSYYNDAEKRVALQRLF